MSLKSRLKPTQELDGVAYRLAGDMRFAVSRCGKVLGRTGRVLKPKCQGNYLIVSYQAEDRKIRHKYVHRMVAEVWVHNPHEAPEVNHLDGDKKNNHYHNLEWVTRQGNVHHAAKEGLIWNYPKPGQRGFQPRS